MFRGYSALTNQDDPKGVQVPKAEGKLDAESSNAKERDREAGAKDIPVTYVPARNLIFLSYATAIAEGIKARDIYIGANVVDFSGYPDCRPEFFRAFEEACRIGTKAGVEDGKGVRVIAPLIEMSKMEIVKRGLEMDVNFADTHSCYDVAEDGVPCGVCESCHLRRTAFLRLGFSEDPAIAARR